MRLKETFFTYFLPHQEEALGIKERCPINYMAYIKDHFYRAMGVHLNGLRSFTSWIKQGSYYHGLVAQQGRLHECPHLAGLPLPRWPQVMPSESHQESQMKAEATATSSSKPSAGAVAAPVMETSVKETLGAETPAVETPAAPSNTPAPMETGRVGDGQSWAECVEASIKEEFQQHRPTKHPRSQSRRHEPRPPLPFPLQDSEGRLTSISQLYEHCQGPLLESFLTPSTSNLSFREVVDCVLQENRHASECSLNYLLAHCTHTHQELNDLTKAHGESDKSDKSSRKRIKKEI